MSKVAIKGNASGTATFTIEAPVGVGTDRTLVLPDEAGTVLTSGGAIDVDASAPADSVAIDANGRLGIGTTSPNNDLTINKNANTAVHLISSDGGLNRIVFGDQSDASRGDITYDHSNEALIFSNNNLTERMRIDSSGRLMIGATSVDDGVEQNPLGLYIQKSSSESSSVVTIAESNASPGGHTTLELATPNDVGWGTKYEILFTKNGGAYGSISSTGSSVSYNTSSDYRLKENVVDMTDAIDRVKALNPSRFNFIADPNKTVDGFIAHEVQEIVPEAVTGEKNAVNAKGNPEYQGIDQAKLVPLLTGALQEAIAKIETLEAKVAALEATP